MKVRSSLLFISSISAIQSSTFQKIAPENGKRNADDENKIIFKHGYNNDSSTAARIVWGQGGNKSQKKLSHRERKQHVKF